MIIGIGTDIVNIDRIEKVLKRHGTRFLDRIFSADEQRIAARMADRTGVLAKRWAAKEACSKALGTGMRQGVAWRDITVETGQGGMPLLHLRGRAHNRLLRLLPPGKAARLHLTMSDDRPCATAFVIIEAVPRDGAMA